MTTVTLSQRAQQIVEERLESGGYDDAGQVIEAALLLFQQEEEAHLQELNAKIEAGIADIEAGRVQELTPELAERVKQRGRTLLGHNTTT